MDSYEILNLGIKVVEVGAACFLLELSFKETVNFFKKDDR